jgi:hypothetical protein
MACCSSSISIDNKSPPGVPLAARFCDSGGGAPSGASIKEYLLRSALLFIFLNFPNASRPLDRSDGKGFFVLRVDSQGVPRCTSGMFSPQIENKPRQDDEE